MSETKNLLQEKLEIDYILKNNLDNFVVDNEITVEITLREYRDLVQTNALAGDRIKKAEENRYTRENENSTLRKDVKELKKLLNQYINKYGVLEDEEDEECEDEYEN